MYKDKNTVFITYIISTFLILGIRDAFSLSINQYVLLTYFVCGMPAMTYKQLVSYICCLIPFANGINAILFLFAFLFLVSKSKCTNRLQWIFTIYFTIAEFVALFFSGEPILYNKYVLYVGYISVFFFLIFDKNNSDLKRNIRFFCYATVFVISIITYRTFTLLGWTEILMMRGGDITLYHPELATEDVYFSMNPNTLGLFSLVCYCCLLIGYKKLEIPSWLYVILLILNIIIGALTVSRTWLILMGLATLIYFVHRPSVKNCVIIFFSIIAIGYSSNELIDSITGSFETRVQADNIHSFGNRTNIFYEYNEMMLNNPQFWVWGTSVGNYKSTASANYQFSSATKNASYSMHNATQQIFICTGFAGLLMFIIAAYKIYALFIRRRKIPLVYYFPIVGAFLFCQTIQFLLPTILMMPIIVGVFCLRLGAQLNTSSIIKPAA